MFVRWVFGMLKNGLEHKQTVFDMKQGREIWEIWLEKEERRDKDFLRYLKTKKIKKEAETKELVLGHLDKADHNLKFVQSTLNLEEFNV